MFEVYQLLKQNLLLSVWKYLDGALNETWQKSVESFHYRRMQQAKPVHNCIVLIKKPNNILIKL